MRMMMLRRGIRNVITRYQLQGYRNTIYRRDRVTLAATNASDLTKREFEAIKGAWPCFSFSMKDVLWGKMFKKEWGFNPNFLYDYPFNLILKVLNPSNRLFGLQDKSFVDILFPCIPWARCYVRNICGVLYDVQMNAISKQEAMDILLGVDSFIIKPTVDTGCGKNVRKYVLAELSREERVDAIRQTLDSYGNNFVAQEVMEQDESTKRFNSDSLNTCRITSIYLNGRVSCAAIFRCGAKGLSVDNWGGGGIIVGVKPNGMLMEHGFDISLKKYHASYAGETFAGRAIAAFDKMVALVKKYHPQCFPMCGIVGWDLAVDTNCEPRCVEVNLDWPGILGEQLCSGPFFEERREEIIQIYSNAAQ